MLKLSGRDLALAMKAMAGAPGPSLCIPASRPVSALLRPVATRRPFINSADVTVLTEWRNRFVQSFLTEFEATPSQTEKWLADVVGPDEGKIMFMVDDPAGRTFGYAGLGFIDWERSYGEADNIVRGGEAARGTMKIVLKTLLEWASGQLGLKHIGVRVLSDNPALEFYKQVGFEEIRRVGLRRTVEPSKVSWVEDSALREASRYLVHMVLRSAQRTS
jgi:hypothetical protein